MSMATRQDLVDQGAPNHGLLSSAIEVILQLARVAADIFRDLGWVRCGNVGTFGPCPRLASPLTVESMDAEEVPRTTVWGPK